MPRNYFSAMCRSFHKCNAAVFRQPDHPNLGGSSPVHLATVSDAWSSEDPVPLHLGLRYLVDCQILCSP